MGGWISSGEETVFLPGLQALLKSLRQTEPPRRERAAHGSSAISHVQRASFCRLISPPRNGRAVKFLAGRIAHLAPRGKLSSANRAMPPFPKPCQGTREKTLRRIMLHVRVLPSPGSRKESLSCKPSSKSSTISPITCRSRPPSSRSFVAQHGWIHAKGAARRNTNEVNHGHAQANRQGVDRAPA